MHSSLQRVAGMPRAIRAPGRPLVSLEELADQLDNVGQQLSDLRSTVTYVRSVLPLAGSPVVASQPSEYLTVAETAGYLKVSKETVYSWMRSRGLPFVRVESRRRFRRAEIDAWLARQNPPSSG